MEKRRDQQTRIESKTRVVVRVNLYLKTGEYPRALEVLRGAAAEFPNDTELQELEKLAQEGVKRKDEADRLITESQELFAQRKPAEAIQLLRKAYEVDKSNALARTILANALIEHAYASVEADWLEAETLAREALDLNPAHPTASTVLSQVLERKRTSSIEDWVRRAQKLQFSGDLFAALAWVAEGLAVHPDDPKLVQIQNAIQREQGAQRRQSRRRDLEDLRRMELEIVGADEAEKQALAERIQMVAAKYWTDGEILSIANGMLNRLGLAPEEGSTASAPGKGGPVIFHVPRTIAPKPVPANTGKSAADEILASQIPANQTQTNQIPQNISVQDVSVSSVSVQSTVAPREETASSAPAGKVAASPQEPQIRVSQAALATVAEPSTASSSSSSTSSAASVTAAAPPVKQAARSKAEPESKSKSVMMIVGAVAVIIVVVAVSFFLGKREGGTAVKAPAAATSASAACRLRGSS